MIDILVRMLNDKGDLYRQLNFEKYKKAFWQHDVEGFKLFLTYQKGPRIIFLPVESYIWRHSWNDIDEIDRLYLQRDDLQLPLSIPGEHV